MKLARVAAAIDFSPASEAAAQWVAAHFLPGGQIVLVHAVPAPGVPGFLRAFLSGAQEEAERALAEAGARLRTFADTLPIATETDVRAGRPAAVIPAAAAAFHADIVAIGAHGHRPGAQLGTTADQLVRSCKIPVLVARQLPAGAPTRLLVAVDDSELTAEVLGWGAFLSRRFGAPATVLHALGPGVLAELTTTSSGAASRDRGNEVLEQTRLWLASQMSACGYDSTAAREVVFGDAAHELVTRTETGGYDLLVMGSRGAGAASRALLGSVASLAVRNAYCPVFVV